MIAVQFGLFTAVVGKGHSKGKFETINWGGADKFLQVESPKQ